jgi:hypothetical protein
LSPAKSNAVFRSNAAAKQTILTCIGKRRNLGVYAGVEGLNL